MISNVSNLERPSIFKPLLILTGAAIILTVMHFAASFLMPILMGVFFAVLLTPIYRWFKNRRIPGGLPLLLSIGVLVIVVILLVMLVGNSFSTLASDLAVYGDQFAQQQAKLESMATNLTIKELISALDPANMVNVLRFILGAAREILTQGVLIILITTFVLAEAPQFKKRIVMVYGTDHFVTRNLTNFTGSIISYFGLRVLVNLVVAVGTGIMLWLFNIPNAGLWAVMTFFLSFVPYIGAVIALIPPIILAYAQGGPVLAATIIVLAMVINGLSENIVAPMVMGKGLSVSPTVVFLSFIFWMFILGGSGALIAMPLTVGLILFMSSYEETRGLAAIMGSSTPTSE